MLLPHLTPTLIEERREIGAPGGAVLDKSGYPFAFNSPTNVSPAVTLFGGLFDTQLQVFLAALAENQYLRLLAEPNLVALSGEEASFLAGGEFPIPVVQGDREDPDRSQQGNRNGRRGGLAKGKIT